MMLFVVDPPIYGRLDAGVSSTIATHQPAETTMAPAPASNCQDRRTSPPGPATR